MASQGGNIEHNAGEHFVGTMWFNMHVETQQLSWSGSLQTRKYKHKNKIFIVRFWLSAKPQYSPANIFRMEVFMKT